MRELLRVEDTGLSSIGVLFRPVAIWYGGDVQDIAIRMGDSVNRVCTISEDGQQIVHSHGGQRGSETGQYNGPLHVAVDDNMQQVFVADFINRRVTLLSPTLEYVRQMVSPGKFSGSPCRLSLDAGRRYLCVADNEVVEGKWILGRVLVFSV